MLRSLEFEKTGFLQDAELLIEEYGDKAATVAVAKFLEAKKSDDIPAMAHWVGLMMVVVDMKDKKQAHTSL